MSKNITVALFVILAASFGFAYAESTSSPKLLPYSVDYPLKKSSNYRSPKSEPYELTFGVRRWLNPNLTSGSPQVVAAVNEANNWFDMYGGYGVLGHGEEVFTHRAAAFRQRHRGR